jgi:hypothetical protein
MKIVGGQYCSDFKERMEVTKELERVYKSKVKIHIEGNFLSYTAFTSNSLAR